MRNFPTKLCSKLDYLNCIEAFPAESKQALQKAFSERQYWFRERELTAPEKAVSDATHCLITDVSVESEELSDETENSEKEPKTVTKYYQGVLQDNPCSDFFRFGFTEEEYLLLIKECNDLLTKI